MFDPASIGIALSIGSKAFSMLKQGIAAGRVVFAENSIKIPEPSKVKLLMQL